MIFNSNICGSMRGKEIELQSLQKSSCHANNQNQQSNGEDSQRKNNRKCKKLFRYGFYNQEKVREHKVLGGVLVFLYLNLRHNLTNLACIL